MCAGCGAKLTVPEPLTKRADEAEQPVVHDEEPEAASAPLKYTKKELMSQDLVDMTAMVDIVFFLLIFFLVTSMGGVASTISMPQPNPQNSGGKAKRSVADFGDYVKVRIDRDDGISMDGEEIPSEQELRIRLKSARQAANAPTKMLVLGSGEAHHGVVVMVLDAGYDAGLEDVQLAVTDET